MTLDKATVQVIAGNSSNYANGEKLAADSHWVRFGVVDADFLWGECKGSGPEPYQVSFRLSERKGKCSCPSRQRPCKHIIALAVRYVNQASPLNAEPIPEWVQQRQQPARKKSDKTK